MDTLLSRALIAVSAANIILTVLMIGEDGRKRGFLATLAVSGGLTLFGRNVAGTDGYPQGY